MKLGVDASNIRAGGGVTHLSETLAAADPPSHGIEEVRVWSNERTLDALPTRTWLRPIHEIALEGGLLRRTGWRFLSLPRSLRDNDIDVLLVPGGIYTGSFRPFVALSQNLLPFEEGERQRFGRSLMRLRIELVRRAQKKTFRAADGLLFNTNKARRIIEPQLSPGTTGVVAAIPFGVHRRFALEPREQKSIDQYSFEQPFRWLYVSTVNLYKHQWNVVAAVAMLRREGMPVALDMIGGTYRPAYRRLKEEMARWDPQSEFVRFLGPVPQSAVVGLNHDTDAVVFASTCETPSFVILESMASGLPIACSRRSAMPEILNDSAQYFDPEDPASIADALRHMLDSPARRRDLARRAFDRAQGYSWDQCAHGTMQFIADVALGARGLGRQ